MDKNYMKNLINNQTFSDFLLKIRGKEYNLHKYILYSNSDYFKGIFDENEKLKTLELNEIYLKLRVNFIVY